nr:MAG TPA: hypothetical protein [Crassvirales sp.]
MILKKKKSFINGFVYRYFFLNCFLFTKKTSFSPNQHILISSAIK